MMKNMKFLLLRRIIQLSILFLFVGGNYFGWELLRGNYSSAIIADSLHLSDPYAVLQILVSGFLASSSVLFGALLIFLIYVLIGGRMFCSWICPMNIISDIAFRLRRILKIESDSKVSLSRNLRYYILALSLIVSAIFGLAAFEIISPISMLHRAIVFGSGAGWAIVAVVFLVDLFILKAGWCGHICPLGGFYSLVGKQAVIKVKHNKEKCTNCMDCFDVCVEEPVLSIVGKKSDYIRGGACTNCGRCIEVCKDDAMKYSLKFDLKK
ncbi:quinol dehydrogenase ferredoxin subunit NapH [Marinifilum sp. JC070]|uniref:Quinol dehydrogenase ferredoxin subunit NapH n=2 Tax=Marinifilum caeruleilacunae TaxID=2499076 RepID=A0ABX1WS74_9BACT|nr:quinol dehydrogenase ferredoxin subunit NapH [Marinifilum caeruleilacunae]